MKYGLNRRVNHNALPAAMARPGDSAALLHGSLRASSVLAGVPDCAHFNKMQLETESKYAHYLLRHIMFM